MSRGNGEKGGEEGGGVRKLHLTGEGGGVGGGMVEKKGRERYSIAAGGSSKVGFLSWVEGLTRGYLYPLLCSKKGKDL